MTGMAFVRRVIDLGLASVAGCLVLSLAASEPEDKPALSLVTDESGEQVFVDREGNVVGWLATATEAGSTVSNVAPPHLPGWPLSVGEVEATPTVADVDGDGALEVAFSGLGAYPLSYVVRHTGEALPGWPYRTGGTGNTPTLADLDHDGRLEVLISAGQLWVLDSLGHVLPGWPTGLLGAPTVGVEDLDRDGEYEIVAPNRLGHAFVWNAAGGVRPGWPFQFPNQFFMANKGPALGDVDGDGIGEIAFPMSLTPSLYLLSLDGAIRPGFPLSFPFGLQQGVTMADVNDDGRQELVFQENAMSYVVDGAAHPLPGWPVNQAFGNIVAAIGDIDGDGRLEFVGGSPGGDARVFAYHADGTPVAGWPVTVPQFSFNSQPTLGDIDGDGGVDIVLGGFTSTFSSIGRIYAWHADGTPVAGFPFDLPDFKSILGSSVTITDLDQDGDVDLLVGAISGIGGTNDGRVFAFDLGTPYDPTTMHWPTLGHDVRHTSRYEPPDKRPLAVVTLPASVECTSPTGALITLDGSASEDPDSTPGTHDDILSFEWFEDFGLPTQVLLGTGEVLTVSLPLGSHALTLRVRDRAGAKHQVTTNVAVVDTTPPHLDVTLDPSDLWPPNHRMVPIQLLITVTDECVAAAWVLESVASSEPDDVDGPADGNTSGDIGEVEIGTADASFELRAERSGSGSGRLYTATYRATDASANSTLANAVVSAPHDLGDGAPEPLLLTVRETAAGTLLEWTEVAGAQAYNVVRGRVGNLSDDGDAYALGSIVCLAQGIADLTTTGREDIEIPGSGETFFYLAEYYDGRRSSYGSEDAAKARDAGSDAGGCP
jgi:hypothetical protein